MTKSQLIDRLQQRFPALNKHAANVAVDRILRGIAKAIADRHRVEIRNFGVFENRVRPARHARNPRTGLTVRVQPKAVPYFRTGKRLKDMVNEVA